MKIVAAISQVQNGKASVWRRLGLEERKILLTRSSGPEVIERILPFNEESKLTIILLLCFYGVAGMLGIR
jgi:hypothetical protein